MVNITLQEEQRSTAATTSISWRKTGKICSCPLLRNAPFRPQDDHAESIASGISRCCCPAASLSRNRGTTTPHARDGSDNQDVLHQMLHRPDSS